MKTLFIGFESAWQYWHIYHYAGIIRARSSATPSLVNATTALRDINRVDFTGTGVNGKPLHLIAKRGARNSHPQDVVVHSYSELPPNSFRTLTDEIAVSSPELSFVQIASSHSLLETILFGMEICGSYAPDPIKRKGIPIPEFPPQPQFTATERQSREPLTTKDRLETFCASADGMHGVKRARQALRWVRDGSESQMETVQYLALYLKPSLGGLISNQSVLTSLFSSGMTTETHWARRTIASISY